MVYRSSKIEFKEKGKIDHLWTIPSFNIYRSIRLNWFELTAFFFILWHKQTIENNKPISVWTEKEEEKNRENTSNKNVFLFVCYFSSIPMINFHIFFSYWPFRNSYLSFSNIFKWWMVMFFIVPFHKLLVQFFINRDKFTSFPSLSMFFLSVFFIAWRWIVITTKTNF